MCTGSFFWGDGFETMFTLVFVLIIGIFVVTAVKGLSQWNKNNHCPRPSVTASVVSKGTNVSRHNHSNAGDVTGAHSFHSTTSTSYYTTFQVESGDRMELSVIGTEYGLLAEGDRGKLTFQGTRYLGLKRLENVEPVWSIFAAHACS